MDITNTFELPLPPATAWSVLVDIPRIMPCIPGAQLLEIVDASNFKGKVSVKLGPVELAFVGTASVLEIDAEARRAQVRAKGNDSKGRGGVLADITFTVSAAAAGSTVAVLTRVSFSGPVAQYGRGTGVIQSVTSELIAQFARNLKATLLRSASEGETLPPPDSDPLMNRSKTASGPGEVLQPVPPSHPIGGLSLLLKVLWNVIGRAFRGRR